MEIAKERSTGALISVAAVIVIVYGMQAAKVLLVPFLLAVFLALISFRPMLWLQQKKVPSIAAALLIVIAMMLILAGVGGVVGTSIAEFTAALPRYQARLDTIVQGTAKLTARMLGEERTVIDIGELVDPGWAMGMAANILNALQDVLTNTFLILFTMVFILLEASGLGVKVQAAFGRSADSLKGQQQFVHNLGRYMGIKTAISLVTGVSAATEVRRLVAALNSKCDIDLRLHVVENRFFGGDVTVAGLLTGQDLLEQLANVELGRVLLVPDVMLREGEDVFLDNVRIRDLAGHLQVEVEVIPSDPWGVWDMLDTLCEEFAAARQAEN